jgi:2-dehydro-3-deoxyphosphooctonate aldolase (KDO 8-P synthase)
MLDILDDLGSKFVYDITHSVQRPGGQGASSGGDRRYVPHLARAGSALGISSFFIEVHADPDNAPSDGPNMLKLEDFEEVVENIVEFNYAKHRDNN